MTGLEPWLSGVESNDSGTCATIVSMEPILLIEFTG